MTCTVWAVSTSFSVYLGDDAFSALKSLLVAPTMWTLATGSSESIFVGAACEWQEHRCDGGAHLRVETGGCVFAALNV
jgi:hypothetical protein